MLKQNCAENNNGSLVSKLADAEIKTEYCEYCINHLQKNLYWTANVDEQYAVNRLFIDTTEYAPSYT